MPRATPPDRRDAILAAARSEFAERGFAAARMEDIARRVGISKAALYLQFASKEALFRALIDMLIGATLPQLIPQGFGDIPARALLTGLVTTAITRITTGDIAFVPRLIIGEGRNFPEIARYYHDTAVSQGLGLIERVIRHGVARGEFREVDARHVARSVIGGVILAAIWRTVFEPVGAEPIDVEAMAAAHLDVLLNGLLRQEAP
ncbi:TetR/AcrR family transcriptional regulator [Sphingomonas sp.]|uniref:TetR/AcrR family transcriptional regulator n=1 Tax=Sphingomonas sp. TaxID=28214 RepID=UPI001B235793|nr:TetR/AcrR family transcriptional regulator [Sphingomonas sp.]MBO9713271.1 TetR/AcrR family transcriptional regulator [Sphingomonas sp.]